MQFSLAGDLALLAGALLLTAGALLSGFAERFRAPALLLFLGLGMAIGDDGLGLISFDDAALTQQIGVAALVVILFEGGLSTTTADLRRVAAPAGLLATVGVALTATVVAGGVLVFSDLPPLTAALIGAIVASTDAAAVFAMLRHAPAPRRLTSLLEAESGGNDPMAVLLTVLVLAVWEADPSPWGVAVFGLRQLVGGALVGVLVGQAGALALRRLRLGTPNLYPVLALGLAGVAYGLGALAGASGFLAVYVAGLLMGSASPRHRLAIRRFHQALATVAQITLFLLLGLLVFPSQLPEVTALGLATAGVLVFVARPLAVAACVPWFGYQGRDLVFLAWAGLRGAVPIVLATFPLTAGYPEGPEVFDVVFFVVLVSAALQGLSVAPMAKALRLDPGAANTEVITELAPAGGVDIDLIELELTRGCAVVNRALRDVPLPRQARVSVIVRGQDVVLPRGETVLQVGDLLVIVAATDPELAGLLQGWATRGPAAASGG